MPHFPANTNIYILQWRRRTTPRLRRHSRGFQRKSVTSRYRTLDKVAGGKIQIPCGRSGICPASAQISEWKDSEARFAGMGQEGRRSDATTDTVSIIMAIAKKSENFHLPLADESLITAGRNIIWRSACIIWARLGRVHDAYYHSSPIRCLFRI